MAIETIIGKLSTEALGKAAIKTDELAKPSTQNSSFKEMLTSMDTGESFANSLGIGEHQTAKLSNEVEAMGGANVSFSPSENFADTSKPQVSEKVVDMLGEVNKGQMQMDNLVNHIMYSGKKFSNQELLVIQAHVFHFAQMTELTVKVAEQGVSSVKAVLNTQVQ